MKGGTAATATVIGSASIIGWMVAKVAEVHPSPWLATASDQAMVGFVLNVIVGGPLGLLAALWQHKKQAIYNALAEDDASQSGA